MDGIKANFCAYTAGHIIAKKGQKQVGKITSRKRGKTVTVICTSNTAGATFVPPMMIIPCKNTDSSSYQRCSPWNNCCCKHHRADWFNHIPSVAETLHRVRKANYKTRSEQFLWVILAKLEEVRRAVSMQTAMLCSTLGQLSLASLRGR